MLVHNIYLLIIRYCINLERLILKVMEQRERSALIFVRMSSLTASRCLYLEHACVIVVKTVHCICASSAQQIFSMNRRMRAAHEKSFSSAAD